MHIRQQIREAAEARLAGLATTGARVFKHHYALGEGDYPALRITTWNEASTRYGDFECGGLIRTIELLIEAWAAGGDELEDVLDAIAAEVEVAIDQDDTLGALATDTVLQSTEKAVDVSGDRRVGRLVMTFTVRAQTATGDPATAL
ncbi:MAG: hypothetical protein AcusKO_29380 [Acuticoccus sp.]